MDSTNGIAMGWVLEHGVKVTFGIDKKRNHRHIQLSQYNRMFQAFVAYHDPNFTSVMNHVQPTTGMYITCQFKMVKI